MAKIIAKTGAETYLVEMHREETAHLAGFENRAALHASKSRDLDIGDVININDIFKQLKLYQSMKELRDTAKQQIKAFAEQSCKNLDDIVPVVLDESFMAEITHLTEAK